MSGRWRHLAEVNRPFDGPTLVCYWWSVDISVLALTVRELFTLFEVANAGGKRKPPVDGAAWRK
jgi:hypothetical protein